MTVQMLDLGWCIGRLDAQKNVLRIVSLQDSSEGVRTPVESVIICGDLALIALRDALIEAYPINEREYKGE